MGALAKALKARFSSPQEALARLGLDSSLLDDAWSTKAKARKEAAKRGMAIDGIGTPEELRAARELHGEDFEREQRRLDRELEDGMIDDEEEEAPRFFGGRNDEEERRMRKFRMRQLYDHMTAPREEGGQAGRTTTWSRCSATFRKTASSTLVVRWTRIWRSRLAWAAPRRAFTSASRRRRTASGWRRTARSRVATSVSAGSSPRATKWSITAISRCSPTTKRLRVPMPTRLPSSFPTLRVSEPTPSDGGVYGRRQAQAAAAG